VKEILLRLRKVFRYLQGKDPWLGEILSNRVPSTNISLEALILKLRGKEIWRHISPLDWVIHCGALYSRDIIVIGGHLGESSEKLKSQIPKLRTLHIYEPIPEFYKALKVKFESVSNVSLRNLAIAKKRGPIVMEVWGDSTLALQTGRSLPVRAETEYIEMVCEAISLSDALEEVENIRETSILMNCEGSEYDILDTLENLEEKPFSIVFQTHTTGENSYERLYKVRAQMACDYIPIVCEDWAWDVWLRKDTAPLSAIQIERHSIHDLA
jgi:FkbM family methyltransferase